MNHINPNEKICYNCKHILWQIGVGQGLRCGFGLNKSAKSLPPIIPSRFHTCEHFEFDNAKNKKTEEQ